MSDATHKTLEEAILKLRKRVQQIRDRKESIGEQNTKAALVDPLLSALGWDLQELDEVSREYKRKPQDNPVDYALFILRTPRLFVEAKDLDKDLNDRKWISQTLGYATVVGVEWCVLTNGDEYRLYNSHAAVDVEEKLFRAIRISDFTTNDFSLDTLELLSKDKMGENLLDVLWKAHFIDRHVKVVLNNLIRNEDSGLIRLIRKNTPGLSPTEIRESLKRADIRIDFPTLPTQVATSVKTEGKTITTEPPPKPSPRMLGIQVSDLIQAGLIEPPFELETEYKGRRLSATVQTDGKVLVEGEIYDSLSTAAGMARKTVIGAPPGREYPQTNGWSFWKYRNAITGNLEEIDLLRQRYLNKRD